MSLSERAEVATARIRALLESNRLRDAPDDLLDGLARAVGDLARLRSGSESDVRAAVQQAELALETAEEWIGQH